MNGVEEVEELTGPTLQDTEQECDRAPATNIISSPRKQFPSQPALETSTTQRPKLEIISKPEHVHIPSEQHQPTIESDPVPPTIRKLEEILHEETITTNRSAHDHNPVHRDYHDQRHALRCERISEEDREDMTTPLET